ncbi:MAG: cyclic nucleotide-binding domain-containing protein [Acidobacteriia bacterium]|nr:cyclic nucleotide-binding domain-containing protein [Terriglobia bacterium]
MLTILEKADLLQSAEIFCEVRTQSLARVAAVAQEVHFEAHQRLYGEHEVADALYVFLDGEVSLTRGGAPERKLARFQVAGALALLANQPQREAAVATQAGRALRIGQQSLFDAMAEDFNITRGILRALAGMAAAR